MKIGTRDFTLKEGFYMGDTRNIPSQALQLLGVIEELFGNQLIGVYLYGSAILGSLRIDSDVDILVIINGHMPEETRSELTKRLMLISGEIGSSDKRPLEVTVINLKEVSPWRFPPKYEYMYGEWLREELEAGTIPQADYDPDLAILLWQARSYSLSLKGPEAVTIIKPIPREDLQRAIQYSLPGLIASLKGDERNVLLTLARMWFTASTGKICSKDAAAEWAIARLPQNLARLLETARKAYLGEGEDCWNDLDAETASLVTFMKQSIEKLLNRAKSYDSSN